MKCIFELSGEHPDLPFAEAETLACIEERATQVAVAECDDPDACERLAMTHTVMEYLGTCDADERSITAMLQDLSITTEQTFAARVRKMEDATTALSQLSLERLIGANINGPVSLDSPQQEYRAIIAGDKCYFGRVILHIDRGSYQYRNPMRRPFFHPGVMMPITARTLVNLARTKTDEIICDPFCGTGGVLLEAKLCGMKIIGSDMDQMMIDGCRKNLPDADLFRADATKLPLVDDSVDAVVTDLPYGHSVCIMAESMNQLYSDSLQEIRRILKPGGRCVIVTHVDIQSVAEENFTVVRKFYQRIHKSLTRQILILE
ncbi:methyltransferase domain-containing protein [Methanogenium organophilum]|uniref:tRNA (guanine(10)-N(2))-dimethyltransferase n=1 Tax=Methanogenium organophilum TaxID=2199 RepID=A0A9X9T743_METOG|nr:methyltransferase domain-containing protein [Methanogenium organophilum]WAI00968.1 methyltransferase domain-containing protein [Methanogenium organophilum]